MTYDYDAGQPYPRHAIMRDPFNHRAYKCMCGERVGGSDINQQRDELAKHIARMTEKANA